MYDWISSTMNVNRCSHKTLREHLFGPFPHPSSFPCKREKECSHHVSRQFHVDKLSSAHIYLRMQPGQTWDNLPEELVMDLAQLTKANSIEGSFISQDIHLIDLSNNMMRLTIFSLFLAGNKKDNITVIYTPWSNLKKDGSMDVGQVSFHDQRKASHTLFLFHLLHPHSNIHSHS